jgi:hypothetical protein
MAFRRRKDTQALKGTSIELDVVYDRNYDRLVIGTPFWYSFPQFATIGLDR